MKSLLPLLKRSAFAVIIVLVLVVSTNITQATAASTVVDGVIYGDTITGACITVAGVDFTCNYITVGYYEILFSSHTFAHTPVCRTDTIDTYINDKCVIYPIAGDTTSVYVFCSEYDPLVPTLFAIDDELSFYCQFP